MNSKLVSQKLCQLLKRKPSWIVGLLFIALVPALTLNHLVYAAGLDMTTLTADFGNQTLAANEALISQTGAANVGLITQNTDAGGFGHYAEINQSGSYNQATINQVLGSANSVRINQSGSYDIAYTTQNGATNSSIDIIQTGNGAIAYIMQSGTGKSVIKQ